MQLSKLSLALGLAAVVTATPQSSMMVQVPAGQSQNPQSPQSPQSPAHGPAPMGAAGSEAYPVSGGMPGNSPKGPVADEDYPLNSQLSGPGPVPDSQIQLSGAPSGLEGAGQGLDDLDAMAMSDMYGIPLPNPGTGYPPKEQAEGPMALTPGGEVPVVNQGHEGVPKPTTSGPPQSKPSHVYEGASDSHKVAKGALCAGFLVGTFAVLMS